MCWWCVRVRVVRCIAAPRADGHSVRVVSCAVACACVYHSRFLAVHCAPIACGPPRAGCLRDRTRRRLRHCPPLGALQEGEVNISLFAKGLDHPWNVCVVCCVCVWRGKEERANAPFHDFCWKSTRNLPSSGSSATPPLTERTTHHTHTHTHTTHTTHHTGEYGQHWACKE